MVKLLLCTLFITTVVHAVERDDTERMKRKLTLRMYQITEGALARCPQEDTKAYQETLDTFNTTYPELITLVAGSAYRKYAIDQYVDDIHRSQIETTEALSQECLYKKSLLTSMINTAAGKQSVAEMIKALKQ